MGGIDDLYHKGDEKVSFGENLSRILKEKGIPQKDVAAAAGVTRPAMTYFITDEKIPALYTAKSIADFLGVTLDELVR